MLVLKMALKKLYFFLLKHQGKLHVSKSRLDTLPDGILIGPSRTRQERS